MTDTLTPYQVQLLIAAADPADVSALRKRRNNIRDRCNNPRNKAYPRYGGRGIKVCQEWEESSDAFVAWCLSHGYEPGLSVDRRDNDGPYSPDNCRMATPKEQASNRRDNVMITVGEEMHTLAEWARRIGTTNTAIRAAIKRGEDPAEYISKHLAVAAGTRLYVNRNVVWPPVTVAGETHTIPEWGRILGVLHSTIYRTCRNHNIPPEVYIQAHLDMGYHSKIYNYSRWMAEYEDSRMGAEQKEEIND